MKFRLKKYIKLSRVIFATGIIFIIFMIFYFPHYARLKQLREANRRLTLQMHKLEEEITNLEKDIKQVSSDDPSFYEKIARDELGVVKEGEIVIDIQE
ncbi:MAG: septum formation initiator family protein [Candidatus Omnitrophota bacterium]|nr:MAG: septum formation initiator family protein [Candidatus Omnitrophota bacterium]